MQECTWSYKIGTWNSGEPFDYRNVVLRSKYSLNTEVSILHNAINTCYNNELKKHEERVTLNPDKVFTHRDLPRCRVSEDEAAIIGDRRLNQILNICKDLFEKADIVFLQEVMLDEIPLIKKVMPNDFECCVGKDIEGERVCVDTMVIWNGKRFAKIAPEGNETPQRRSTMVMLRDKTTQKIVEAASLHARGFNIANPSQGTLEGQWLNSDQDVINMLELSQKADIKIFGGDFNSHYEVEPSSSLRNHELSQRRFKLMEEAGFMHIHNRIATCFNQALTQVSGRENGLCILDHVFVSTSENDVVCGEHQDDFSYTLEDVSRNPSDHRPMLTTVSGQFKS